MTVCIATLCENRKVIVLAADRMISTRAFETEFATSKITRVHDNWWVLMAAADIAPVFSMVDQVKKRLADIEVPSLEDVVAALEQTFWEERQRRSEIAFLRPYGMILEDFVKEGRVRLGDNLFQRIHAQIGLASLDCELMLAGFDETGTGQILTVRDPGQVNRYDNPGFFAIGSGASNAVSMLYYRAQDYIDSLTISLYQVNEAKIFAGFAPGVGWETEIVILRHREEPRSLAPTEVKRLDDIWAKYGSPRLPTQLNRRLRTIIERSSAAASQRPEHGLGERY